MIASAAERKKVLVIDDELGPRESLRFLLKDEYQVVCADNVDAGMVLLRREIPDLVIMDIRMPGKTGIQGLRELREIDPLTSVIMLTGFGALETAQEALRLGANDYISKPFDTVELKGLVSHFTQRSCMERKRVRMLRELQDMNSRLVEDIAGKDRLVAIGQTSAEVMHDMRNPLMIVVGYINLLSDQLEKARSMLGGEFEQAADYLDVIETNLKRCCNLAAMWQKPEAHGRNQFQPMRVKELMDEIAMSVEPLFSAINVRIEYEISDADAVISGSRTQLVRAVHNFISNALDAVESGRGKILLACQVQNEMVEIRIKDNGCGMPADVVARMFEPYFTTKDKSKGTGLGTVIAKRVVEEHSGRIAVESLPGCGTTIIIQLPLHHADAALLA